MAPSRLEGSELYFRGSHFIDMAPTSSAMFRCPVRPPGFLSERRLSINVTKALQNYKYFDEYLTFSNIFTASFSYLLTFSQKAPRWRFFSAKVVYLE
jgi:hypothetical protein